MDSFLASPDVVIVGAGPTGLTLAIELARRGVAFRLIDAAPAPARGARGKGVQPRTLEIFEDLGIAERVLAGGRMAMPIRATAVDGTVTLGGDVPASLVGRPDIPFPASLITPQWRVEDALRGRLAELGRAPELGAALERLESTKDGVAAMISRHGAVETIEARWLVGCDGGHSTVRKQAGIAFEGETRDDVRMIVADCGVDGLDREAWHMWRHPEGLVSLCPLPSTDAFAYQASLGPGDDPRTTLANMQALLDRRTGRRDLRLHTPTWSSLWRANIRLAARFRAGRVFLAGDAAHVHSPAGGQGMNTGIQDAYNLGWKLARVLGGGASGLLDTYEAERRPVAAAVLDLSNARLEEALAQQMPRRDASTLQLDVGYRGSVLARDDRDASATLRAGDRAPDATHLDGGRRLFEFTRGGRFTLLRFGDAPACPGVASLRIVGRRRDPDDIVDDAGHLARAYGAGERTLVLIRPDGHIGLISDAGDAAAVSRYLAAL